PRWNEPAGSLPTVERSCIPLYDLLRRFFEQAQGFSAERAMNEGQQSLTGADLVVRRLRDHGVRVVFGYPGGQLTPLYDALHRDGTIRHVLARDEQAAG